MNIEVIGIEITKKLEIMGVKMKQKKGFFTLEQLCFISNLVIWGTVIGGLLIWLCMPWNVPIYHTGNMYYDGSKLPLLILVLLPFLAFFLRIPEIELHSDSQESKEVERLEKKQWFSIKICLATLIAIIVFASLLGVLIVSR